MQLRIEFGGHGKIRRIELDTTHLTLTGGHLQTDRLQTPSRRCVLCYSCVECDHYSDCIADLADFRRGMDRSCPPRIGTKKIRGSVLECGSLHRF